MAISMSWFNSGVHSWSDVVGWTEDQMSVKQYNSHRLEGKSNNTPSRQLMPLFWPTVKVEPTARCVVSLSSVSLCRMYRG